ncbi:MAG TPA: hypothetical protein VK477_12355, partial [Acidobacteriota bacterium]|nr:hypothetical protein [Acidobacteriota bacterium]
MALLLKRGAFVPMNRVAVLVHQPPLSMSTKHLVGLLAWACAFTATFAAEKNELRVEASRALRLAIIDRDSRAAGHDTLHSAFAEALAFDLSQRCKEPVPVKPLVADAD